MRLTLFIILFALLGNSFLTAQENTRWLTVEPNHSTIGFRVPIADGITLVTGKFTDFDLQLALVDADWTKSNFTFSIQAESIHTGIADRDEHLRSADFFEIEKYPEITFVSKEIRKIDDTHFEVNGTFSMHGLSQAMTIPFEILGQDGNTIGLQVRTRLNRIDYGVGVGFKHTSIPNFLAQEIEVEINFWTKRDKRKEK